MARVSSASEKKPASLGGMDGFTVADVLGCVGADLTDVARRVGELPAEVQAAAAGVELSTITTAHDALSREVHRVLVLVAAAVFDA